jgi:hypothetical protein
MGKLGAKKKQILQYVCYLSSVPTDYFETILQYNLVLNVI